MPLEIRELTIKVDIQQNNQTKNVELTIQLQELKEEVLIACMKKIKDTMQKSTAR